MNKGKVKWFNEAKGFGFITSEGKDYFVYFKEIMTEGYKTLKDGQHVTFSIEESTKGPVAKKVQVVE